MTTNQRNVLLALSLLVAGITLVPAQVRAGEDEEKSTSTESSWNKSNLANSVIRNVVIPASAGVACGIAGSRLPRDNAVDSASTYVGTLGTIYNLTLGEDYASVFPSVSFLAAYLITRTFRPSQSS